MNLNNMRPKVLPLTYIAFPFFRVSFTGDFTIDHYTWSMQWKEYSGTSMAKYEFIIIGGSIHCIYFNYSLPGEEGEVQHPL